MYIYIYMYILTNTYIYIYIYIYIQYICLYVYTHTCKYVYMRIFLLIYYMYIYMICMYRRREDQHRCRSSRQRWFFRKMRTTTGARLRALPHGSERRWCVSQREKGWGLQERRSCMHVCVHVRVNVCGRCHMAMYRRLSRGVTHEKAGWVYELKEPWQAFVHSLSTAIQKTCGERCCSRSRRCWRRKRHSAVFVAFTVRVVCVPVCRCARTLSHVFKTLYVYVHTHLYVIVCVYTYFYVCMCSYTHTYV